MPGIRWGCSSEIFSPAFWKFHARAIRLRGENRSFKLGKSLIEEVAVCLLGGHGLPAELGLQAFQRVRDRNLLRAGVSQSDLEQALSEPLYCGGRFRRYRFPRQKAKFLWHAIQLINVPQLPMSARAMRDHLITVPGIGPKTASWIVRNHFGSDDVAILDVHILRAGVMMGVFAENPNPTRDYLKLERRFLDFCQAIEEPASLVDALIWDYMRRIGPTSTTTGNGRQLQFRLGQ